MPKLTMQSWLVAAGRPEDPGSPLNVPMVPASNFDLGGKRIYSRDSGAPGWEALEEIVAGLEGGDAVAFSSGMAAVAAVFDQLGRGARVVLPDDCYHGVSELAKSGERKGLWQVSRLAVEATDAWTAAAQDADLLWLESPSNPLLTVADLRTICSAPRKEGAILVVDNTFATPLNQRPLQFGADISMHSATKFIGGHSDLLAGLLVTNRAGLYEQVRKSRTVNGATPGTLEAFLAVRGLRTLALRLEQAQETAGRLARWLDSCDSVERVRYPGLESHPTHAVAASQLDGFGTMISFDAAGGAEAADRVCLGVKLIRHATSLGSVESTMERRAAVPGQEHLPPGLLRLSVGIESFEDLRDDLEQALA
ncbi:MAG: aminotransferase class I/II-fold pyridoxal phosphate-dependent enzyme [Xanthomonadales bacterium]|nr:aminotransferase class I/II-fold pyridoxal phosphate-dependent enzyme [Gammaproteobacteria bacterium]MBT8052356.1 aminotransferase class I/II-fold pyridoxal phosphate-dependent enzyme [Gammaproteobacteria bacterium]NND56534.1 aminotransferase class I/II-fold pyridoxal phosphate-dependent enzyme [Xanthomonadales bacterium]NNK52567.1 aminotransferase class I/II-fold pyridoxal phosphate-dependent enzyme [Xanthomonadales bacterium]